MNFNNLKKIKEKTNFGLKKQHSKNNGSIKEFIAKLSKGLMLPIAILPIAGLFLGIGATIVTQGANNGIEGLVIFGNFLKLPGDVIFGALPVLFAIAIAIAFTKDSGVAALSAIVGFLAFGGIQNSLIEPAGAGYNVLFYTPGSLGNADYGLDASLFGSVLGIRQLQTSVFGGFIVGFSVAFLYNKFRNIQLPSVIGFFSGARFIPIITFISFFPITLIVLMIWPLIGTLFSIIGGALGGNMFGFNSFIFGYIERALVPFGLHHAFYSPLWYTSVGGTLDLNQAAQVLVNGQLENILWNVNGTLVGGSWLDYLQVINPRAFADLGTSTTIVGDQGVWAFLNSNFVGRDVSYGLGEATILKFDAFVKQQGAMNGINPGQYMQGKYPFMMFGLPAAAAAMVMAAPKENRKEAASILLSAGATSFLTGITEPIEFTFLFLAPWLFWGVHSFLAALSFGLMNWIGLMAGIELAPHIGMTFSGGFLDWVVYGAIQIPGGSNAWWALILGLFYAPLYYSLFFFLIKKYDIQTIGRGSNKKLYNKEDFQNKMKGISDSKALAINVINAYGGIENIKNVDACITKLRIQISDQSVVDAEKLKSLGAVGVIKPSKQSVYSVFGPKADLIKNEINDIIKDIENNPTLKETLFKKNIEPQTKIKENNTKVSKEIISVSSPIDGLFKDLKDVPDPTFSKKMIGEGFAIIPTSGKLYAPFDGEIEVAFPGGHAYLIKSKKGTSILIHIGIDSINIKEKGKNISIFKPNVVVGDKVKKGDLIVEFDNEKLSKLAKSNIIPIVVLNETLMSRKIIFSKHKSSIKQGEEILVVKA